MDLFGKAPGASVERVGIHGDKDFGAPAGNSEVSQETRDFALRAASEMERIESSEEE